MPTIKPDYLEAMQIDIRLLLNILPSREGTLYTPNITGIKCARPAMQCFMREIDILEEENENRNITNTIQNIKRNLQAGWKQVAKRDAKEDKICPLCESYEEQNYTDFLNRLVALVQFVLRTGFEKH
ncbi:interleukin-15-like [Anolis sagrei]|uniref:interleukin-15-like n=1 Tax=Anolis sagrei TaxID=38937 RepID=UPI00351F8B5F